MLNILYIGDIVGEIGIKTVEMNLKKIISAENIDFTVANAENSSNGLGVSRTALNRLQVVGVDFFSSGNHIWDNPEVYRIFQEPNNLIRPANYPSGVAGDGYRIHTYNKNGKKIRILIINLLGRLFVAKVNCPFREAKKIIDSEKGNFDIVLIDFHAETTAEKQALAYYLDGEVSLIVGTHTHVMTNDDTIFPKGCGYITDLGMCGSLNSIIGVTPGPVLEHLVNRKFSQWKAENSFPSIMCGLIAKINSTDGKTVELKKVRIQENGN